MTWLAFYLNPPPVQLHNSPSLREAQAQSAARFAARKEWIEDVRADCRWNAGTGVGDGEDEFQISDFRFQIWGTDDRVLCIKSEI